MKMMGLYKWGVLRRCTILGFKPCRRSGMTDGMTADFYPFG
jgi:hypothetical protein